MIPSKSGLKAASIIGLSFALPNCAGDISSLKMPAQTQTLEASKAGDFIGPFLGEKILSESLCFYVDRAQGNVFSIDCRLVDMIRLEFEKNLLVFNPEQMNELGLVRDNKFSELGIEKRGKQLRLVQLPEHTPIHLAITEQSFISVASFSAQISPSQGKPGLLFIIGEMPPYKILFAYSNDAGETTIADNLNKDFPAQFASALCWHRETLDKIYSLGSSCKSVPGAENYFSGESQFTRDLPARFLVALQTSVKNP